MIWTARPGASSTMMTPVDYRCSGIEAAQRARRPFRHDASIPVRRKSRGGKHGPHIVPEDPSRVRRRRPDVPKAETLPGPARPSGRGGSLGDGARLCAQPCRRLGRQPHRADAGAIDHPPAGFYGDATADVWLAAQRQAERQAEEMQQRIAARIARVAPGVELRRSDVTGAMCPTGLLISAVTPTPCCSAGARTAAATSAPCSMRRCSSPDAP